MVMVTEKMHLIKGEKSWGMKHNLRIEEELKRVG